MSQFSWFLEEMIRLLPPTQEIRVSTGFLVFALLVILILKQRRW